MRSRPGALSLFLQNFLSLFKKDFFIKVNFFSIVLFLNIFTEVLRKKKSLFTHKQSFVIKTIFLKKIQA